MIAKKSHGVPKKSRQSRHSYKAPSVPLNSVESIELRPISSIVNSSVDGNFTVESPRGVISKVLDGKPPKEGGSNTSNIRAILAQFEDEDEEKQESSIEAKEEKNEKEDAADEPRNQQRKKQSSEKAPLSPRKPKSPRGQHRSEHVSQEKNHLKNKEQQIPQTTFHNIFYFLEDFLKCSCKFIAKIVESVDWVEVAKLIVTIIQLSATVA